MIITTTHTHPQTHKHTHTHIHTYIHTYIPTYVYTYIHIMHIYKAIRYLGTCVMALSFVAFPPCAYYGFDLMHDEFGAGKVCSGSSLGRI